MKIQFYSILCIFIFGIYSCQEYTPKPSGYFRIDLPSHNYEENNSFSSFSFLISDQAIIKKNTLDEEKGKHFNIFYNNLNAEIFCSFIPTNPENIPLLSEESRKFVYGHIQKADAISEKVYKNPTKHVFGLIYYIQGNVASPTQFILTDSMHSFFRGALYFNNIPNQDSIIPALDYINKDIQVLIESFQWK